MARPPSRAERQSRSPGKPRPIRVAAKCGPCFLICKLRLLGIVVQATTFVARLAFIRILPATQSAWDLFRGSLGSLAHRDVLVELEARSLLDELGENRGVGAVPVLQRDRLLDFEALCR